MDEVISLIVKLAGALLAIGVAIILPKAQAWLTAKVGSMKAEKIMMLVQSFVRSAEQMYWDKTGSERKAYVLENLTKLGYSITSEVNALIEAEVFKVHSEAKG